MVLETLSGIVIDPEAVILYIIILIEAPSCPFVMALDAKVVVRRNRQQALSCATLKKSLCQRDRSRNVMFHHLLYGDVLIPIYIVFVGAVSPLCHRSNGTKQKCKI